MKQLTPDQIKAQAQRDAMVYIVKQHPDKFTMKYRDGQLILYKNIQMHFGILEQPECWMTKGAS